MPNSWIPLTIAPMNQQLGGIPTDEPPVETIPDGAAVPFIDTGDSDKKNGIGGLIRFAAFVSAVVSQVGAALVIGTTLQGSAVAAPTADRMKSVEIANGIMVNPAPLNPSATTDLDAKIIETLDLAEAGGCREIILPPGEWRVPANFLVSRGGLASGTTIRGAWPGATTIYLQSNGTRRGFWHTGNDRTGITFKDLKFVGGYCDDIGVVIGTGCRDTHLQDIECTNAQLTTCGGAANWEASNSSNWTYGTVIERCRGQGNGSFSTQGQFILLNYSWNWIIRDCKADNYAHGIQWWGGDGAYKEIPGKELIGKADFENQRKCGLGLIDNCVMTTMWGGGIWGSMGDRITVRACFAKDCGDINFDSESGDDILFDRCIAENGRNALFGTYFAQRRTTFHKCIGRFTSTALNTSSACRFYNSWNSSNVPTNHRDILLDACEFESTVLNTVDPLNTRFPYIAQDLGAIQNLSVINCKLRNGTIYLVGSQNSMSMVVKDCTLDFDGSLVPTAVTQAIHVGRPQYPTVHGQYETVVENCTVTIRGSAWPAGSSGILFNFSVAGIDWTWSPRCVNNVVKTAGAILTYGFHVYSRNGSANSRIRLHFGGNECPDSFVGGGTIRAKGLYIDEVGASTAPVQVILLGRNKSIENGVDFGPALTRTLTMVKVPGAITGGNTIALADTSNLQVGDTVRMTGATNAGNNNTDFIITALVANVGATPGSITVNRVVVGTATEPDSGLTMQTVTTTAAPLTNETPPGTARLYKRILPGTKRLVTTSAVGNSTSAYGEVGSGTQALSRMRYRTEQVDSAPSTGPAADERLEYDTKCFVHGTISIYVENPTDAAIDCVDVTLYMMPEGRLN